jgi:hypothetical protein
MNITRNRRFPQNASFTAEKRSRRCCFRQFNGKTRLGRSITISTVCDDVGNVIPIEFSLTPANQRQLQNILVFAGGRFSSVPELVLSGYSDTEFSA